MAVTVIAAIVFAVILLISTIQSVRSKRKGLRLPPGPRRLPFIGNTHQAPKIQPWITYQQWTKEYGPIFSLKFGFSNIIMLGNWQAADDLLNKRSAIYPSRPHFPMGNDVVSKDNRSLLMRYGPKWRANSKIQMNCVNIR
jgi:cytochrome P450